MNMKRFSCGAWVMLIAAALLLAAGGWGLMRMPVLWQYAMVPPAVQEAATAGGESEDDEAGAPRAASSDNGFKALIDARDKAREKLMDSVQALSLAAYRQNIDLAAGNATESAQLWAVDDQFLACSPRYLAAGRYIGADEHQSGAYVAVLDEDLAFKLFRNSEVEGRTFTLADATFTVIGTVRHTRGVGEGGEYALYIPLTAARQLALKTDAVILYGKPTIGTDAGQSFFTVAKEQFDAGGCEISTRREVMRCTMILRLALFIAGMVAVFALWRKNNFFFRRAVATLRERRQHMYWRDYLPCTLPGFILPALGYVLLLAACYGLFAFAIDPVYTFTDWVPESLVSLAAIAKVFWQLIVAAAAPIGVRTPELSAISFNGALVRWGVICLLGALALPRRKKITKSSAESPNSGTEAGGAGSNL